MHTKCYRPTLFEWVSFCTGKGGFNTHKKTAHRPIFFYSRLVDYPGQYISEEVSPAEEIMLTC